MPTPVPPKPPNSDQVDPLLESLLENARPILAKERGLNQKSRMQIQAIGRKMKIPEGVIDQAIQILHGAPPLPGGEVSKYESTYALVMREKISEIPGGILTNKIEEKAISVGVRKYQLSEVQARRIVRQIADEVNIPRVSLNEAERHVEQEIAEVIGEATWITGEKKQRLFKNAKRLGVSSDQVKSMIQRHLQFNFQQVRNERKLMDRLWVVAACIVVFLAFGLFIYTQLQPSRNDTDDIAKKKKTDDSTSSKKSVSAKISKSPDWWDDELKALLQKTRLRVNGFSVIHDKMKGASASSRSNLYQEILTIDEGQVNSKSARDRIELILPPLYKADPELEATGGMLTGFAKAMTIPNGTIPVRPSFFGKSFWALRQVNEIISDESLSNEKAKAIQKMMTETCGRKLDLFLSKENRFNKQRNVLLEKYFVHLVDIGSAYPVASPDIFAKLTELASDGINDEKIQQFRYSFLVSFLRFESKNWTNCAAMIDDAIANSTVPQISFFVDLMESSDIEALQNYLQVRLHRRAAFGGDPGTIAETATELRRYFALDPDASETLAKPKRELLDAAISQFVNTWTLKPKNLNQDDLTQLWAEATYVTTLAVLENTSAPNAMGDLIEAGFPNLSSENYVTKLRNDEDAESNDEMNNGDDATDPALDIRDQRNARQRLQESLKLLNQFKRLKSAARINEIRKVASLATTIDTISGIEAGILADYLLTQKNTLEATQVDELLPAFRNWNRLLVSIADQLLRQDYPRQRAIEVASRLLNRDLNFEETNWEERLSQFLLQEAQSRVYAVELTKKKKQDPLVILKKSLGHFYSLRAEALGLSTRSIAPDDLDAILNLIIDDYKRQLSEKKLEKAKVAIDLQANIVDALGKDPLTRISLKQKVILESVLAIDPPKKQSGEPSEAFLKLSRMLERQANTYPTVIGQMVQQELEMLRILYTKNRQ